MSPKSYTGFWSLLWIQTACKSVIWARFINWAGNLNGSFGHKSGADRNLESYQWNWKAQQG